MLFSVLIPWAILAPSNAPPLATCRFHSVHSRWVGSCGPLFEQTPGMTIAPTQSITSGIWRKADHPRSMWTGDMTDAGSDNATIELEIYAGGAGVLRTEYGWFPVSKFSLGTQTLRFKLDTSRQVPPSELDRTIVKRAAVILSSRTAWNRADDRQCSATATTWSIYCAMQRATVEVTGGFHHRRPALEVVRQIVDKRAAGRRYHHRLMDYNNDPTTRLEDVQSLFAEALTRLTSAAAK
jgi:hypothetical protein